MWAGSVTAVGATTSIRLNLAFLECRGGFDSYQDEIVPDRCANGVRSSVICTRSKCPRVIVVAAAC